MADLPGRQLAAAWIEAVETSPAKAAAVHRELSDALPVVAAALDHLLDVERRQRAVARAAAVADMRRGPLRRADDARPGALLEQERHPPITRTPATHGPRPR